MITSTRVAIVSLLAVLSTPRTLLAQDAPSGATKTLSPYFWVDSTDPSVDRLPLKDTRVDVNISGVIADVTVRQVYENSGQRPLHARYVFPASTRAAVYGMTMTVGDIRIVAKIKEREQAKNEFVAAKREGKSASLLEQSRPNVFTMNVANVLPGDTISVELKYTELLVPTDGVYEFIYPTVVGPRYSSATEAEASEADAFVKSPYMHSGVAPKSQFHLSGCRPAYRFRSSCADRTQSRRSRPARAVPISPSPIPNSRRTIAISSSAIDSRASRSRRGCWCIRGRMKTSSSSWRSLRAPSRRRTFLPANTCSCSTCRDR
jgi:hypothetical protein